MPSTAALVVLWCLLCSLPCLACLFVCLLVRLFVRLLVCWFVCLHGFNLFACLGGAVLLFVVLPTNLVTAPHLLEAADSN